MSTSSLDFVEDTLAQLGHRRRVAVAVPPFLLAPHIVATSDLVLTVRARVVEAFAAILPVEVIAPPMTIPDYELRMYWHERHHRAQLSNASATSSAPRRPQNKRPDRPFCRPNVTGVDEGIGLA